MEHVANDLYCSLGSELKPRTACIIVFVLLYFKTVSLFRCYNIDVWSGPIINVCKGYPSIMGWVTTQTLPLIHSSLITGSYKAYAFSASSAFSQAKASTESSRRVMVDKKAICNYGALRLKEFGIVTSKPAVTDEFIGAVKALPTSYNQNAYISFIEDWGTVR